jgi:hypothetical protein
MTKIETFAQQHRLKVTRDECNDQVIQGRRGHLDFDVTELCLVVLDGKPAIGFFCVLGMGYLMMILGSSFNWPEPLVFAAIAAWGILLGAIAWSRYRLSHAAGEKSVVEGSGSTSSSGKPAGK